MNTINNSKIYSRSKTHLEDCESSGKEKSKSIFISQEKNFGNKHGFHYRSSAQFYFILDQLVEEFGKLTTEEKLMKIFLTAILVEVLVL